eukprot:Sspe_Gene.57912::Locus_31772_Transcript_1_1_Confidence_1.000_Length_848::g.57912::m.57912
MWCNLFENGEHHIDWHNDNYGVHLVVVSFGATRRLLFRTKKTKELVSDTPVTHGMLYYMSPNYDKAHEHSVPAMPEVTEPRISIAVFCSRPGVFPRMKGA